MLCIWLTCWLSFLYDELVFIVYFMFSAMLTYIAGFLISFFISDSLIAQGLSSDVIEARLFSSRHGKEAYIQEISTGYGKEVFEQGALAFVSYHVRLLGSDQDLASELSSLSGTNIEIGTDSLPQWKSLLLMGDSKTAPMRVGGKRRLICPAHWLIDGVDKNQQVAVEASLTKVFSPKHK